MGQLTLERIGKSYGCVNVLAGIDLDVAHGEFIVFVGPSGCGKSTLLRMIAGLEPITRGHLRIDGELVNDRSPVERRVAMVFQSYALYPHMTVARNLSYGLRVAGAPKDQIATRVAQVAKSLQIDHLLDRLPKDLSGGQRQRVAIGRAIVREPKIFLFDEPLSNLDAALRVQTRLEIAKLHNRLRTTTIYVTHDQTEAMTLADRIVVLNAGEIAQVGTPLELYRRPQNMFVAGFIGSPKMNLLSATVTVGARGCAVLSGSGQTVELPFALPQDASLTLGIRPEDLRLTSRDKAMFELRLEHEEHMGEFRLLYLRAANGLEVTTKVTVDDPFSPGDVLPFTFDPASAHLFDADQQRLPDLV